MNDSFRPGELWLDTAGKPIQAHGGSIIVVDGVYHWYGENKERTDGVATIDTPEGPRRIWHWGVRCYRSRDLYNWEDMGCIIPPDLEHPGAGLHPASMMDRPHILFNKRTGLFVAWLKIMQCDGTQTETVLTAPKLTGPWTVVREGLLPLGMSGGDFDLATAADGKAYYVFDRVHSTLVVADLTDDYTNVSGFYSEHFPRPYPPFVREAPAHFERDHKHYLITSGTTGYLPNPSEIAVSELWHGPYRLLGNPHPGDPSNTSFHTQVSSVFKVPGKKDLYIALGDRWQPRKMDLPYDVVRDFFIACFTGHGDDFKTHPLYDKITKDGGNTSIARYVWLPFVFHGEQPVLEWRDEWRLEEFE